MSGNAARQLSPFIRIMIAIFLLLLAVWIVLKIYIARSEPSGPQADGTKVSIFVTAGLKGYREPRGSDKDSFSGMARWASLIDKRRTQHPAILLDAGDFCGSAQGNAETPDIKYFFEGMRMIGYAAAGIGSDEIRFGHRRLHEKVDRSGFELLSSNIFGRAEEEIPGARYTVIRTGGRRTLTGMKGGLKIGVFSVALPRFINETGPGIPLHYDVLDPRIAALEAVSVLKEKGCDLIVALSYQSWPMSLALAESVDGIDIVINGRREHDRSTGEKVGRTTVVDTGIMKISLTEVFVEWTGGSPGIMVRESGPEAKTMKGRDDLVELEKRYMRELEGR